MRKLQEILGYAAALFVSLFLVGIPFGLLDSLTRAVGRLKLVPLPAVTGGEPQHRIVKNGYVIDVNRPVLPWEGLQYCDLARDRVL